MVLRKPWAREWARRIHAFEGSGCLNAASTVDVATTGLNIASGFDHSFQRADLYFTRSESRVIELSISNSNIHTWIYRSSDSDRYISVLGGFEFVAKRYDPFRLKVTISPTGYAHWKIYTEEL